MTDQRHEYDVVVVGSGGGAMTGGWLAAHAGLSTVVVQVVRVGLVVEVVTA